jgi:hypothetical protein
MKHSEFIVFVTFSEGKPESTFPENAPAPLFATMIGASARRSEAISRACEKLADLEERQAHNGGVGA